MLTLAKQVGNACRELGWQVTMTRMDDRDVSVQQRSSRANRAPSTCFISLHACLAVADDSRTDVAVRVTYQGGRGLGFTLATAVHDALVSDCGLADGGIIAAPRLHLLRWCSIPAVLVEVGNLAEKQTTTLLTNVEKQQLIAAALAGAVGSVFGQ